jgi:hypothetical protein
VVLATAASLECYYIYLAIDRNCNVLPLSLDDLLNYTTLMLTFCTNKPIWALLLRQIFGGGGKRGCFAQKKGVTLHPRATDFREKKSFASSIRIVSYCKYDMYFNKYDMYSIVGIDKKRMEKELVKPTYIRKDSVQTEDPTYLGPILVEQRPQCDREWDHNPTRQAIKSGPRLQFDGVPPSPIHEC